MKPKNNALRVAALLLIAAFLANGWLQIDQWRWAIDNQFWIALTNFNSGIWLADFMYYPAALFLSFIALVGAVLTFSIGRKWPAVVGAVGFILLAPLDAISMFLYFLQTGEENPFGLTMQYLVPTGPQSMLSLLGTVIAIAALVVALASGAKGKATGFAAAELVDPIQPIGFDTQTGRPILRYDSRTGKPIYADEKPQG